MLWSRSRPEPDFFAGAGAGEKAPAPDCYGVALGYCSGKVATILIKFGHFLTIFKKIVGKNRFRYTFKKA